jgi:nicotinate-nucleotide pyrophosphorylase (carboxylating)
MIKKSFINNEINRIIKTALKEDIGAGDITTKANVNSKKIGHAQAIAKDDFVVAGINIFKKTFLLFDKKIKFKVLIKDGDTAKKGEIVAQISGALKSILQAERVALNLLQRMCGIASQTRKYVEAVNGTKARILDTRKTVPGLRVLDKMAVKIGGGFNHRMGLYDGVLIKDNHITAAGSIKAAVEAQKKNSAKKIKIEVETKNLEEVEEALVSGADIIMLDNMPIDQMKKAMALIKDTALVEASGNINLNNVEQIAKIGVDFISVGEITHSVKAADISLKIST